MNEKYIINELERNKVIFKDLLSNIHKEYYLWKQNEKKWCLLEIICHLYDEEREDFRARVKFVLELPYHHPGHINPFGWVTERKYLEQDYELMLEKFLEERKKSISWLNQLNKPNWNNFYSHPELGKLTAKMFLANWLAHDYLHIRQIVKLKYDYLKDITNENLSYAGKW